MAAGRRFRGTEIAPGVTRTEFSVPGPSGRPMEVWVYLPSAGRPSHSLSSVFVAPAGTPLFVGNTLGEGDVPEHVPYAQAGFAVVAYELDGALPSENPTVRQVIDAATAFRAARSGIENARLAREAALKRFPQLDPARVYTAGHSSAATVSLMIGENEPRLRGCIAYAPCTNLRTRLAPIAQRIAPVLPWLGDFAAQYSPDTHAASLRCPVLLFHAEDDQNVAFAETERFADLVRSSGNKDVTFARARSGGHYGSMIREGIPRGIAWLRQHNSG